ncbi:MAG TPA: UDP-N-acetylglucosamine 1-carboxyvinyltransferase [Candidatus Xenobia bacterium]|jgi:UDP-N-acetylglucosamine 1-carboxyvinyltransferase
MTLVLEAPPLLGRTTGERIVVDGGISLRGRMRAPGSKNACLPIMAACLLARGDCRLEGVPDISDVHVMSDIMRALGAKVELDINGTMWINTDDLKTTTAPYDLVRRMNASFDVAGPLLARYGHAEVALPGGCNLGQRPVNLHLDGFRMLGADVSVEHGNVLARASRLKGTRMVLAKVSVGATENLMMAATLADGVTILENAAREPEVSDLAHFLNRMGAHISGIGTSTLTIEGVTELQGTRHHVIPDRIATGTYMLATAITGGDVVFEGVDSWHLGVFLHELHAAGQSVEMGPGFIRVQGQRPVEPLDVATGPFPGFATDLHPPLVSLLALGTGTSIVEETIFDGRFQYVNELNRMGADIRVTDRVARIRGVRRLAGAPVEAPDIRAGGALILAALVAEGRTSIGGVEFIDRGYEHVEETLSSLGARIRRTI